MGVTNLDTLIIRLESQGGAAAAADVKKAETAVDKLKRSGTGIGGVASGLLGAVRSAMNPMTAAFGAVGVAGAAFGVGKLVSDSIEAAAEVERLTATLTALSGSADIAKAKMGWISRFGTTSQAEVPDLRAAGVQLEASGLSMEKLLPTISNIAGAFGATRENVMELAGAFGRVRSGVYGEMLEQLRRFGITTEALMAKGIRFDGGGQAVAQWQDMLSAIVQISEEKFGRIGKLMNNTFAVRLSNLRDSWSQVLEGIGVKLLDIFGPVFSRVSQWLSFMVNGGWLESLMSKVAAVFGPLKDNAWVDVMMSGLMAAADVLPSMLGAAAEFFTSKLNAGLTSAAEIVGYVQSGAMGMELKAQYYDFLKKFDNNLFPKYKDPAADWRAASVSAMAAWRSGFALTNRKAGAGVLEPAKTDFMSRWQQYLVNFGAYSPAQPGANGAAGSGWGNGRPLAPGVTGAAPDWPSVASATQTTARNTGKLVDQFRDMRTEMFGGGDRSRRAVSHAEVQIALARALGMGIG